MRTKYVAGCTFVLGALLMTVAAVLQAQERPAQPAPRQTSPKVATSVNTNQSHDDDDGDIIFAQNCSRCHSAPESFSPRITGTVVRHMRVRAQLSQANAEAVLRFLNP